MTAGSIYSLRPADVFEALSTSLAGLSDGEVPARQELYGKNVLTEEVSPVAWQKFLGYMAHPLSWLLWIAGVISFLVKESVLGLIIWLLVFVNAGFSYWREHRTEQAMQALRKLLPVYTRVIRGGMEASVPADQLVPGDVLILAEGDNVPADARVVEESGLRINNAILTGDAVPARITADASLRDGISELERPNLVFAGTSVVSGTGRAVVYATGMLTQFGRIAHLTQTVREEPGLLQVELYRITRLISIVACGIGVIVFIVGAFDMGLELHEAFLLALGILVAAIPEGLPAIITLTLAMAGQRLAQHDVLVRKLSVIETLGIVSTVCTDKSGTLTQNQMTVRELWAGGENFSITGGGYQPKGKIIPAPQSGAPQNGVPQNGVPQNGVQHSGAQQNGNNGHGLKLLLSAAMLCNNSRLSPPSVNRPRWTALGDQTEAALRVLALKGHVDEEELAIALPRIHELPFEARRKRMSTIHSMRDGWRQSWLANLYSGEPDLTPLGTEVAFVKGAPREVLQLCSKIIFADEARPLDDSFREQIIAANDRYARRGLRVLALAFRILAPRTGAYHVETVECDLSFLGLVGMLDPARPEVADAVQVCKQAGVRLVMITGDYGLTAESLARRVGMLSTHDAMILTGAELDGMDDAALYALLEKEVVFARMAPEHKLRLVTAFQARGEVVAVIGDGVNDAPALRKADVGIAMGVSGTDVAKEAADLVLVNDNFAAIIDGIKEGRAIYDNLRKFMTYVFSSNVPEILPFILTALINIPLALTVRQILAIDLGTDMLPGLALGTEEPEPDIMRKPPRRRSQPLIDRSLLVRSFLWLGLIETVLAYTGFILVNYLADNPPSLLPVTVFHAGVVMAQVGNAFAARSEIQRGRKLGWLSNRFLIQGVVVEIGLILLLVYFPPLARAFNHVPIPPILWLWLMAYPVILYGLETVRKFIVRRSGHVVAGSG